jgi:transposase
VNRQSARLRDQHDRDHLACQPFQAIPIEWHIVDRAGARKETRIVTPSASGTLSSFVGRSFFPKLIATVRLGSSTLFSVTFLILNRTAFSSANINDFASAADAAGIDAGDISHWACVESTPDAGDTVREFPAHTAGLRQWVDWLRQCGVTTVALEATGVYAHFLFLTLLEASFVVVMTAPQFARQIKGRPKTEKQDCQWIQRLHKHGLSPAVFRPDEATQTLRDYVRQRANLVRLSGQRIQRMQKALQLMNLKLTRVHGDVTGVTGLKIIRAVLAGQRDPQQLAKLRDRRCWHSVADIAQALDGRYRSEHVTERRCGYTLWQKYQEVIGELDQTIDVHLRAMRRQTELPPLPPKPSVRGRKPHDPRFDVRGAMYLATGVDLTAI